MRANRVTGASSSSRRQRWLPRYSAHGIR